VLICDFFTKTIINDGNILEAKVSIVIKDENYYEKSVSDFKGKSSNQDKNGIISALNKENAFKKYKKNQ